jgi:hypothetical protein
MRQKLISQKDFALLANVSEAAVSKACVKGKSLSRAKVGRRINAAHSVALEYVAKRKAADGDAPDPLYDSSLAYCIDQGHFTQVVIAERFGIGRPRAKRILDAFKADGLIPEVPARKGGTTTPRPKPNPLPDPPKKKGLPGNRTSNPRGTHAAKLKRKAEMDLEEEVFEIPDNILAFQEMTLRDIIDKFGTDERFTDFLTAVRRIEEIHERRLKSAQKEGELVSRELVQVSVIDVFNNAHLRLLTDGAKSITAGVISKHASGASDVEIQLYVADLLGSFIRPVKRQIARSLGGT